MNVSSQEIRSKFAYCTWTTDKQQRVVYCVSVCFNLKKERFVHACLRVFLLVVVEVMCMFSSNFGAIFDNIETI